MGSRPLGPNGFMKVGDAGVIGLMGGLSGRLGWIRGWINRAQVCNEDSRSVVSIRNKSVVGDVSFVVVRPTVRLERRFRSLSVAGSGEMFMTKVGNGGPCFR